MNIPNLITIGRIFLVPVIVWLISIDEMAFAFWLFLAAGVSDGIDGYIAKHYGQETMLGAYLDPLADKALLVSVYVTLGLLAHLPLWLVILVVSRDILIIAAVILSWMLDRAVPMHPHFVSKANTTGQIVLAVLVLADIGFGFQLGLSRQILVIAVAGLTVASAIVYMVEWLEHMARYEEAPSRPAAKKPQHVGSAKITARETQRP
jgi:cardiolipin synthase